MTFHLRNNLKGGFGLDRLDVLRADFGVGAIFTVLGTGFLIDIYVTIMYHSYASEYFV